MTIFVGNLSHQASEEELQDLFVVYGEVKSAKIITDKYTKRSKGFAFVEMTDQQAAEKAIEQLNNSSVHMRTIVVNEARPKNNDADYSRSRSEDRY